MFNFTFRNYKKWCQINGLSECNFNNFRAFRGLSKVSEMHICNIRKHYSFKCRCREQVSRLNEYLFYKGLDTNSDIGRFIKGYERSINSFHVNPTERTLLRLRIYRQKATIWEVENID